MATGVVPGLASWGVRFGAVLLDALIVMLPLNIILSVIGVNDFSTDGGANFSAGNAGTVIGMAVWFAYTALMHMNGGQTLGKKIVKIKVVASGGQPWAPRRGSAAACRPSCGSPAWAACSTTSGRCGQGPPEPARQGRGHLRGEAVMDLAALERITLPDVTGEPQRLGGLWADRRTVLVFLRHFG